MTIDESKRCPLCGESNMCGVKDASARCWCVAVSFRRETLAQIPAEARGRVCICPTCAQQPPAQRVEL